MTKISNNPELNKQAEEVADLAGDILSLSHRTARCIESIESMLQAASDPAQMTYLREDEREAVAHGIRLAYAAFKMNFHREIKTAKIDF